MQSLRRASICCVALGLLLSWTSDSNAQAVRVVQKPVADAVGADDYVVNESWTVSYSRVHAPDVFLLDSVNNTESKAMAQVQKLRAWSNQIEDKAWKLAVILVEVNLAVRSKHTPTLPTVDRMEKDAILSLKGEVSQSLQRVLRHDVQNAFQQKNQTLRDAMSRAREDRKSTRLNSSH